MTSSFRMRTARRIRTEAICHGSLVALMTTPHLLAKVCGRPTIIGPLALSKNYLLHIITFRVSRRRREMYSGRAHFVCLSVCLSACLSAAACPHYCTNSDVTWGNSRRCPLVVHCWADLCNRCTGCVAMTT